MVSPYLVVARAVREQGNRAKADVTCDFGQQHAEFADATEDFRNPSQLEPLKVSRIELVGAKALQGIAVHSAPEEMPCSSRLDASRRLSVESLEEGERELDGVFSELTSHCASVHVPLATDSALCAFKVAARDHTSSCSLGVSSPTLSSCVGSMAIGEQQTVSQCPSDTSRALGGESTLSSGHSVSSERLAASRSGTARSLSFTHIPVTPSTRVSDGSAAPTPNFTAPRPCGHRAAVAGSTSVPCSVSWQAVAYGVAADTILPRTVSRRREEEGATLCELQMLRATRPLELHVKHARGPVVLNERTRQTELVSPTRPSSFRNLQREAQEFAAATHGETKWLPPDRQTISSALRQRQHKQQPSTGYESLTGMRTSSEGCVNLSTEAEPAASLRPLSLFRRQDS